MHVLCCVVTNLPCTNEGNATMDFPFRSDFRLDDELAFILTSSGHSSMWVLFENMMSTVCSKRSLRHLCCNAILVPLDGAAETLCEETGAGNCHFVDHEAVKEKLAFGDVKKTDNPELETVRVWGDEKYSFQFWMNPYLHQKAWRERVPALISDADISVMNDPIPAMNDVTGMSYACDDPEFDFRANAGFVYQTARDEAGEIIDRWIAKMKEYGTA